jgi:hypothetical protein
MDNAATSLQAGTGGSSSTSYQQYYGQNLQSLGGLPLERGKRRDHHWLRGGRQSVRLMQGRMMT